MSQASRSTKKVSKSTSTGTPSASTTPACRRKQIRFGVSPEDFVRAWQSSPSAQAAADRLGMPVNAIHNRASQYRKKGIKLKSMPHCPKGYRTVNTSGLNDLIYKMAVREKADGFVRKGHTPKEALRLAKQQCA